MPVPFGPRFTVRYTNEFDADRRALGLAGRNFGFFFEEVERQILDYPRIHCVEVPDSGGVVMRATRSAFFDIPPLYVYYRVVEEPPQIVFMALSPAWSKQDFFL